MTDGAGLPAVDLHSVSIGPKDHALAFSESYVGTMDYASHGMWGAIDPANVRMYGNSGLIDQVLGIGYLNSLPIVSGVNDPFSGTKNSTAGCSNRGCGFPTPVVRSVADRRTFDERVAVREISDIRPV